MDIEVEHTSLLSERTPLIPKSRPWKVLLATLISVWGTLSFGYCLGYSSPASYDLQSEAVRVASPAVHLNNSQQSWFSSLFALGALFGCIVGGKALDLIGRKWTIIAGAVPSLLGWLLIFFARNRSMLYCGRVFTGVGSGVETLAVAVYIGEISPAHLRGRLGSVSQLAVSLGVIMAYLLGYICFWNWLALLGCIPSAFLFVLMPWMPESPRWYVEKKRKSDALKSLLWLRGFQDGIEEECYEIEALVELHPQIEFKEFFSAPVAKPILISAALLWLQQFSGFNAILFNAADIFSQAGLSDPKLASSPVSLVRLAGNIMAVFLVDRYGRRILLWTNALAMAVSLVELGVYFQIYETTTGISWLSILSSVLFSFFFSLAWGPIPWVVMSEIIPLRARGVGTSLSAMVVWITLFAVTKTYESLESSIGSQGVCWFYAGWCFVAFLIVVLFVPETKGRTLEDIERSFQPGPKNINASC